MQKQVSNWQIESFVTKLFVKFDSKYIYPSIYTTDATETVKAATLVRSQCVRNIQVWGVGVVVKSWFVN